MSKEKFPLADALAISQASNETFTRLSAAAEADRCSITVRLSREQRRQLKLKSITRNKTIQDVLAEAIEVFLKAPDAPPKF
ncbi:hypothetical protein NP284_35960 [Rhodopseudomonas pseudopalustris]|uniref:hypothetical protein n=1 Tax=Rhodopseudomonas pseudopalustris TaxID=1513892 RepID=UPI003F945985